MCSLQRIKEEKTWALNNLLGIQFGLLEFQSVYGRFPDSVTAAEIKRKTGTPLTLSDISSNDIFVQLLATGICNSEITFYTHSDSTRKPDDDWRSDATALAHGETGFAYISGLSATDDPSTPIVFGPVIPGTKTLDVKTFGGKAVVSRLGDSVILDIDSSGKIIYKGMDLLDPRHPIWHGKAPDVKWPK